MIQDTVVSLILSNPRYTFLYMFIKSRNVIFNNNLLIKFNEIMTFKFK